MNGLFITFEGGDAAGKSTQAAALETWLIAQGREVVRTREPGGTELGLEIRRLVLHAGAVGPRAEALLYAADRADHIATVVRPALARGAVVVQDRYIDSSVAYQGAGRVLDPEEVRGLSTWATDGLLPDLTVLLDIDAATAASRFDGRGRDRLESAGDGFHARVREAYLTLAAGDDRFLVLDAGLPVDAIQRPIRAAVERLLAR